MQRNDTTPRFDRTLDDVANVVFLEHVNTRVPDQQLATLFYVTGLGLTRDPYLMTGITNMWINIGRSQFHLPTGAPQVLRGHSGLVLPDRAGLVRRLAEVEKQLAGTRFAVRETAGFVEVTCPWGNRLRCFAPDRARFGGMALGLPYVELSAPMGSAEGIVRFYSRVLAIPAHLEEDGQDKLARVAVGPGQHLIFRETSAAQPEFDGHHVAIYLADFSGPWRRLRERGLISEESDQHQYRFQEIVDPDSGAQLFTLEHEVRSMRHPMYARPLVNRNPQQTNRSYVPGHQDLPWAL